MAPTSPALAQPAGSARRRQTAKVFTLSASAPIRTLGILSVGVRHTRMLPLSMFMYREGQLVNIMRLSRS